MDTPPAAPETQEELGTLVERLNETLRLGGAGSAEQAFGLGCSIGLPPLLLVVGLLYVFKVVDLILAFILLIMGFLVLVGLSMLIAQKARLNGIRRLYQTSVQAEIDQYLAQNQLSRLQFDTGASQILPQDAPLQAFLTQKEQE